MSNKTRIQTTYLLVLLFKAVIHIKVCLSFSFFLPSVSQHVLLFQLKPQPRMERLHYV